MLKNFLNITQLKARQEARRLLTVKRYFFVYISCKFENKYKVECLDFKWELIISKFLFPNIVAVYGFNSNPRNKLQVWISKDRCK